MRLSERGLAFIREREGFRDRAYPDPGSRDGKPVTIGYGSTRYEDGSPIKLGDTITRERADELLRHEAAKVEAEVARLVTVPLTQAQFDALCSFQFNTGALSRSTLLRLLNTGDYGNAADQLLRWNKNDGAVMEGLTRRRQAERAMFLSDTPGLAAEPVTIGTRPDTRPNDALAGFDKPPAVNPVNPSKVGINMAPVLAALLPSLVSLIPELGKLFSSGSAVSERNVKAAEKVAEVVVAATQAPNLQGAIEVMQSNPDARNAARIAVQTVWYELSESGGGGIEGARTFALQAIKGDDWRSIGYGLVLGILAVTIIVGGGMLVWTLLHNPDTTAEQRGMLIGAVVAIMGSVVSFFFGSSVSSRAKDTALVDQLGKR